MNDKGGAEAVREDVLELRREMKSNMTVEGRRRLKKFRDQVRGHQKEPTKARKRHKKAQKTEGSSSILAAESAARSASDSDSASSGSFYSSKALEAKGSDCSQLCAPEGSFLPSPETHGSIVLSEAAQFHEPRATLSRNKKGDQVYRTRSVSRAERKNREGLERNRPRSSSPT